MEETKETVNQENTDKNPETSTFTQEQVDAIFKAAATAACA